MTRSEELAFLRKATPVKGVDYRDGMDGKNVIPVFKGKTPPSNPLSGDIWAEGEGETQKAHTPISRGSTPPRNPLAYDLWVLA